MITEVLPRRGSMFIAQKYPEPPARFGGAELKLTSTDVVLSRPSEPRGNFLGTDP
jgi:hypothetical protein